MTSHEGPVTAAVRKLRAAGVSFAPRSYRYEEHGGTARAARELGVPEHQVVKTLVWEADGGALVVVLMHGDREVSSRELARCLGVKRAAPCAPAKAERATGFQVGGISPFGTRTALPVLVEATILDLPSILINGGRRGFLVEIAPAKLVRVLAARAVRVAQSTGEA